MWRRGSLIFKTWLVSSSVSLFPLFHSICCVFVVGLFFVWESHLFLFPIFSSVVFRPGSKLITAKQSRWGSECFCLLVGLFFWVFLKASFNILRTRTEPWYQPSSSLCFYSFISFVLFSLFLPLLSPSCLWGEGCQPSTRRKTKFNTVVINWNAGATWQMKQWLLFFLFGQKEGRENRRELF